MSKNLVNKISKAISELDNILILTHEKPDGDALGSVFSILRYFQENGKKATLFLQETIIDKYIDLLPPLGITYRTIAEDINNFSNILCIDCSDKARLGVPEELRELLPREKIINIDHHFDNELYGNINLIDAEAAATGEILFEVFRKIETYKISKDVADNLILAIITDTGGLRFDNTDSRTFKIISKLIEIGGDYLSIIKQIFFKKNYSLYMLESEIAINHLKWRFNNKFVYCYVSNELLQKFNLTLKDIENLIDSYRIIEGVQIAALITKRDDKYKISLRSGNEKYPVVNIAHKLNGGGHKMAAGCSIKTVKIEDAENILIKLVGEVLEK